MFGILTGVTTKIAGFWDVSEELAFPWWKHNRFVAFLEREITAEHIFYSKRCHKMSLPWYRERVLRLSIEFVAFYRVKCYTWHYGERGKEMGWGCLLMDGMAASENGVWLYDQHLHPSRWLKMRSLKLDEMNTVADWQMASEGFNVTFKSK